jgi:hypothetical protein
MSFGSKKKHAKLQPRDRPPGALSCACGTGWYLPPFTRCYRCNNAGSRMTEADDLDEGDANEPA